LSWQAYCDRRRLNDLQADQHGPTTLNLRILLQAKGLWHVAPAAWQGADKVLQERAAILEDIAQGKGGVLAGQTR
jgi:hypothetical protein